MGAVVHQTQRRTSAVFPGLEARAQAQAQSNHALCRIHVSHIAGLALIQRWAFTVPADSSVQA